MITVDLDVKRSYQFRYLRDGGWINDGQADAYVHNRHGSDNFVVITDPNFTPHHDEGNSTEPFRRSQVTTINNWNRFTVGVSLIS